VIRLAVLVAVVLAGGALALGLRAGSSPPPTLEARVLAVEQRLLCPQCTNKRLDVCELAICEDMRREIRARLESGQSEAEVVAFFSGRFGDRVLASLPVSGFNLWLWGWVLASVVVVAVLGARWLRGRTRASAPPPLADADERWLDAQLRDEPASGLGR
jgi:cytochrome c-type biogenesis protein CcmH